jgi:hypothetical protein
MTIIPPGYADCSIQWSHSGMSRKAFVTHAVKMESVAAEDVANNVLGGWTETMASFLALVANEVTIGPCTARIGQDGGEALVVLSSIPNVVGTDSVEKLPPNNALLIHKRTSRGGRRGRGRMFLPWVMGEAATQENGLILTGSLPTLQNAINTILPSLAGNGVPMYLLHNNSEPGAQHPTTPGLPNAVTSLYVDPLISTQRRRLGR